MMTPMGLTTVVQYMIVTAVTVDHHVASPTERILRPSISSLYTSANPVTESPATRPDTVGVILTLTVES